MKIIKPASHLIFFNSFALCSSESAFEALNQAVAPTIKIAITKIPAKAPSVIFIYFCTVAARSPKLVCNVLVSKGLVPPIIFISLKVLNYWY
ncbi:Hypothetical protein MAG3950 [Mycoplasmopsis agalactiae PG2]|uniref:Secreted protein n=1 Tax=Mycoplasmopsis agalactiae (strain NCTC 10123 / CIP 59.7 / PG2) TaxID=347257 RepID=A5IYI4_MYCAP|nr:Hypothetical protein MAG3950 [Mycoplasmopsis agalactiae PG2]